MRISDWSSDVCSSDLGNTDLLLFILNGDADTAMRKGPGRFGYQLLAMNPVQYALRPQSVQVKENEPVRFSIKVIPDHYPVISVRQRADSLSRTRLYYMGEVRDDHGLTRLSFLFP